MGQISDNGQTKARAGHVFIQPLAPLHGLFALAGRQAGAIIINREAQKSGPVWRLVNLKMD